MQVSVKSNRHSVFAVREDCPTEKTIHTMLKRHQSRTVRRTSGGHRGHFSDLDIYKREPMTELVVYMDISDQVIVMAAPNLEAVSPDLTLPVYLAI